MDFTILIYIYVLSLFIFLIILNRTWFFFGLSLIWKRIRGKSIGLLFIKDKTNNIGHPRIINTNNSEHNYKGKTYVINSRQLEDGGRFFGLPYVIVDSEDSKTTIGLYYVQCDPEGNELRVTQNYKLGKKNIVEETPMLRRIKPSVTLTPEVLKALVTSKSLTNVIVELFNKHKTQLYLGIGIAAGVVASAYFSYEVYSNLLPAISNSLEKIINNQKLIIESIEVAKNVTN